MRPRFLLFVLLLISVGAAQSTRQFTGFGEEFGAGDSDALGAGGIYAVPEGESGYSLDGPASWCRARTTHLYAALNYSSAIMSDDYVLAKTGLSHIQFIAHMDNSNAFSLAVLPFTRVDAHVFGAESKILVLQNGGFIRYAQEQVTKGGISIFRAGYSRKVMPNLSVGAQLDSYFGTLAQENGVNYLLVSQVNGLSSLDSLVGLQKRYQFFGKGMSVHAIFSDLPKIGGEVGLQIDLPITARAVQRKFHSGPSSFILETTLEDLAMPLRMALGYGRTLGERHHLRLQGKIRTLEDDARWNHFFGRYVKSQTEWAMAYSLLPKNVPEISVRNRLLWRAGMYGQSTELSDAGFGILKELGVTFGARFEALTTGTMLSVGFKLGRRDSVFPIGESETIWRVTTSLSTGEKWFARPDKKW